MATDEPPQSEPSSRHGVSEAAIIEQCRRFADDELFPAAITVDQSAEVPRKNLDAIADLGLYGLTGAAELGGRDVSVETLLAVIEAFAGGCLNTAFVWTQHQGACRATNEAEGAVHQRWAEPLSRGTAKAGVAFAHLLRPGTPLIAAQPTDDGWTFTGTAPWVTGWGYIDGFHAAARHGDNIVWAMIDAEESATLRSRLLKLAAIDASATFELSFDQHMVANDQVTKVQPYDEWRSQYPYGLRVNGSLSLGVGNRALRLLEETGTAGSLRRQFDEARQQIDQASVEEMPEARGLVSALAVRITASLVASLGGASIVSSHHGQRLAREALFLLIQGQTPEIKASQLRHL